MLSHMRDTCGKSLTLYLFVAAIMIVNKISARLLHIKLQVKILYLIITISYFLQYPKNDLKAIHAIVKCNVDTHE